MNHMTEQELIAYRDGETRERERVAGHLNECEVCRHEMDRIEAVAAKKAEETGEVDHKAIANFSLYQQRMHRDFQSLLKTLHAEQTPRLIDHGQEWRAAVLLQDFAQRTNTDWKPSDSGFEFSPELLDKQLAFNKLWDRFGKNIRIFPTTKYQDERYSKKAL